MDFARGQYQVDYEDRIDFKLLRKKRIKRIHKLMDKYNLDALFLWKDENVRYVSSLRAIMLQYRSCAHYGTLMIKGENPILFVSGGELDRAREVMPWIKEFYVIPILQEQSTVNEFIENKVAAIFKKYELNQARIGIDGSSFEMFASLLGYFNEVNFMEADSLMHEARSIKNEEEIKVLREATVIADSVTETAIRTVEAGRRECEVAGAAMNTLFSLGGEFAHLASPFVGSGERMSPPTRFATDKIIRNGDIVFIDIGACWNGYFSDVGRTVICGKPSSEQKKIYTAVYESLYSAISIIKPGLTNRELTEQFIAKAREFKLEENFINLFIGHGVGVSPNEPPYIGEREPGAEEVILKPGMVFALEPLIWVPDIRGGGGVRIEETVLVTGDGVDVLSRASRDDRLLL